MSLDETLERHHLWRMFTRLFALLAVLGFAASVEAADITLNTNASPIILISGYINDDDGKNFANLVQHYPSALVMLNSPGGRTLAAMQIGRKVRSMGLATVVGPRNTCASACGLIWLSGESRYVYGTSNIGFHATFVRQDDASQVSAVGNALVGSYLREMGYSDDVIVYASTALPEGMQWLSRQDAERLSIGYTVLPELMTKQYPEFRIPIPEPAPRKVVSQPHWFYFTGYFYIGDNLNKKTVIVEEISGCRELCEKAVQCVAFSFNLQDKQCFLKREVDKAVRNKFFSSAHYRETPIAFQE